MPLSLFIALRFLWNTRAERGLKVFTFVTLGGILASVALFLLVDAVLNGFTKNLREIFIGFDATATLECASDTEAECAKQIEEIKRRRPQLELAVTKVREFYGLARHGIDMPYGVKARVIDADFLDRGVKRLNVEWLEGFDADVFFATPDAVLLGAELYKNLAVFPGGVMELIHPFAELGPTGEMEPRTRSFTVAGVVKTGYYDIDNLYVFLPSPALAGFADPALGSTRFLIDTTDENAVKLKSVWRRLFPDSAESPRAWSDDNRALFKAMALEKIVFSALLGLLVLISCINLASLIRIFGLCRLKDAAILDALGIGTGGLVRVFVLIGAILGSGGGIFGVALALAVVTLVSSGNVSLPEAYGLNELPLAVSMITAVALLLLAPLITALVAILPARKAAKDGVAKCLRFG